MKRPSLGMAPIKTEVSVEAYREIMRLEKTIERLRTALEYIVEYCEETSLSRDDKIAHTLRKARAALEVKE